MSRHTTTTTPAEADRRFRRRDKDRVRYPDPQAPPTVDPHDDPDLLARRRLVLLGDWPAGYGDDTDPFSRLTTTGLIAACRTCGGPTEGDRPTRGGEVAPRSQWAEVCAGCAAGRWHLAAFTALLATVTGASDAVAAEARRQVEAGEGAWLLPVVRYADAPGATRRKPIRPWSHLAATPALTTDAKQHRWPSVNEAGDTVWVPVAELAEAVHVPDVFARRLGQVERQLHDRALAPPPEAWGAVACWWCGVGQAPRASWQRPRGGLVWCGIDDTCPRPDSDNVALTAPRSLTRLFFGADPEPDDTGEPARVTNLDVEPLRRAGFRFWGELGGAAPNPSPWAHVDLAPLLDAFDRHLALQWETERRREWYRHRDPAVTVLGPDGRPAAPQPWLHPGRRADWYAGFPYPALVDELFPLAAATAT